MGVKFLLTYIKDNEILQKVELSLLAGRIFNETGKKPKLLCDFFNLRDWFWVPPVRALIKSNDYPEYSSMYGGDFHLFADRVQCFVAALNHIGIEPVFFVDGPRGSDDNFEGKISILKQRSESRLHSAEIMQRVCEGTLPTYEFLHCHDSIMSRQLLMTLLKTDAKVVFCCGEADPEIIQYAQSNEETCGVLSSDSDFAITSGSVMFPVESFDVKGTLGLNSVLIDDTPGEIVCEVVCPRDVATHLGIRQNQLPDLAALCGNDYTRDILSRLSILTRLGVEGSDIESVAIWLQDKEVVLLDYLPMRDLCTEYPELRIAMEQSYNNYTVGSPLCSHGPKVSYASHLYPVVEQETLSGSGLRSFLSIAKHGIHWRASRCESITLGKPCFSDTLLPVRKSMYILLGLTEVTEYGRSMQHAFEQMVMPVCVSPSEVDVGIRCFHALREVHVEAKLIGLYQLMAGAPYVTCTRDVEEMVENIVDSSHELPNLDWPKLYQIVTLISCLKMMAILNCTSQPPLDLSDSELDALLVACLICSTDGDIPPHMTGLKPSMRTISVGEWFGTVTSYCYQFACLLHLLEALPEPRNIFYPMVFAPYHIAIEAKPDIEEKYKEGIEYIQNTMQTALALPAVQAVRHEIFSTDQIQPPFQLVDQFFAAQGEIVANQQQLLPRVPTPDSEQLSSDSEDEMIVAMFPLDSEAANVSGCRDGEEKDRAATESSTHEGDPNPRDTPSASTKPDKYDFDIERLKGTVKSLQMRSQANVIPAVDGKAKVIAPSMGLSEKHDILKGRVWKNASELPIMEHRDKILDQVARFQVVCIEGETGCGKSSQVPQFILHKASICAPPQEVKVLINQPNFIAAVKLAERVAEERREPLGTCVGYCSEVERYPRDQETALTFCTTGYMLQVLQGLQTTSKYTHIILDEIHERSTDIDFTMLVVRRLALSCPKIKVILMSATLQGGLFIDYFKDKLGTNRVAEPIFVGIKRFPVKEFCIDELDELVTRKEDKVQDDSMQDLQRQLRKFTEDPSLLPLMRADICSFAQEVCINLIISQSNPGDAILVFLPGSSDISDFYDKLHRRLRKLHIVARFCIFLFHNQVAVEDQEDAFEEPIEGTANVILANRSAESSLTFPDLKLVLNFGVSIVPVYSTKEHITKLTRRWCSRASCIQRAGRVGRVSEGTVVHLFPREFYEKLPDFNPPEIVDAPLSKTLLKAKEICCKLGIALPSILLGSVVQPPSLLQFEAALHDLIDCGALHHSPHDEVSEEADVTLLGRFSISLPLDLNLCRLVLLGILFRCPLDGIVFATAMSMYQDVFTLPTKQIMLDHYQFCSSLARSTLSRMKFDDHSYSNPIMMRNMFIEWLRFKYTSRNQYCSRRELANRFCSTYAVRVGRLLHFENYVSDIARSVLGYIPKDSLLHSELRNLARIEGSADYEPICDTTFFTGHGTSKSPQKPTGGKYVPPPLRHLRTQLARNSSALHFCSSYTTLKALITAAASDSCKFLCGERACESHDPDSRSTAQRSLQMMMADRFPTRHSLAMDLTELDDIDLFEEELNKTDQRAIEKLFRSLPRGYRFPVKVSASDKTAILHFQACSYASASHCVNEIASKIDPTLSKRRQIADDTTAGSDISVLPLEVEFFWRFGEQQQQWEIDDVNSRFPVPFHPCSLMWHELTESRLHVNTIFMNWRNPTAQMCILENPSDSYFSVASKVISTRAHHSRYATSITLLPSMPQGLFILLAFQPTASTVELLVETDVSLVKGLKFNSLEISCTNLEVYITPNRLNAINALRHAISTAMTLPLSNGHIPLSDSLLQSIPKLLQNVLHTDCGSPTELHAKMKSPARTSISSPGVDCVWEVVTPGAVIKNAKPGSLPSQRSDYYPEFRCSLLETEPYSIKEVQSNTNNLSGTYMFEYSQNVADKILEKQARMQHTDLREEIPNSDQGQLSTVATSELVKWRVEPTSVSVLNNGKMDNNVEDTVALQQKQVTASVTTAGRSSDKLVERDIDPQERLVASTSKKMIRSETAGVVEQDGNEEHSLAAVLHVKPKKVIPSTEMTVGDSVARMLAKHGQSKLEQEVVRHLQRNNKMEFFSELMVQRRIKFLCKVHKLCFDIEFFCCRPEIFKVMEVEAEEDDLQALEQEFLIVLLPNWWDSDEDVKEGEEPLLTKSMQLIQAARKSVLKKETSTCTSKVLRTNTSEKESDPTETSPCIMVQIDSKIEQGHHVISTLGNGLTTTPEAAKSECESKQSQAPVVKTPPNITDSEEKATSDTNKEPEHTPGDGEAGQGHLSSVLPNDATITHSSTSITAMTNEVSGSETVDPYTNAAGYQHGSEALESHIATASTAAEELQKMHTVNKPSASEVPTVDAHPGVVRKQAYYSIAEVPANTPVLQCVPMDDKTNSPNTKSQSPRTSEIRTSEVQPEALTEETYNGSDTNTILSHSSKIPELGVDYSEKLEEAVGSPHDNGIPELGVDYSEKLEEAVGSPHDNGKQRSEASTLAAASTRTKRKKKKTSTGASAAPDGAAKSENAVKRTEAPKRKSNLDPGTDDHLAEYLVNVIRAHGGVTRLSYLRKEVYPQYHHKYSNYGTIPYFRKVFLINHPEMFEVYKEDSGMVFVKLVGDSSKVAKVPVSLALSAPSPTKEKTATPTQASKPEAGQKVSGNSKQLPVQASKPASAIPSRKERTT